MASSRPSSRRSRPRPARPARSPAPVEATPPGVALFLAAAAAPGTFARSLSDRSASDQGLVTGMSLALHYLLSVGTQDALAAAARFLAGGGPGRARLVAADCAAVPVGLAVQRLLPPRPGEPLLRGAVRQAGWRVATTGAGGAVLTAVDAVIGRLDARLGMGGRLASLPLTVPAGLGLSYLLQRRDLRSEPLPGTSGPPSAVRSLGAAAAVTGVLTGCAYGEHYAAELLGRGLAALLPGPSDVWRLTGHAAFMAGLATGVSAVWDRAMQRIEAGTSADVPVFEAGEATRWVPPSVSGGPGSLVPWPTLGREGRRHALTTVRAEPLAERPAGVPDLSIETVTGMPPRAHPVQVYVGLDSARSARERVDLALAEMDRAGAFDRSLIVLVSPTGTGYVNYVAVAAVEYLTRGDVATVTLQYSRRPSPLSLGMVKAAREQNRLLWLRILERVRRATGRRPRVVLFGESLGAHTSQDVFLHWGTLGLEALGIDRALWIGTPHGSKWMQQVTGPDRLDVDRDTVAVVNDFGQLEQASARRGACPRYVLLSHDNDGVTTFGPDLLWTPPRWLGPDRPKPQPPADGESPRGIPPGMRWRPITTFFQNLVDMKNAQQPGSYRAWAHDYRADLPRFLSAVYDLPASREEIARIEAALRRREDVRERLFAPPQEGSAPPVGAAPVTG